MLYTLHFHPSFIAFIHDVASAHIAVFHVSLSFGICCACDDDVFGCELSICGRVYYVTPLQVAMTIVRVIPAIDPSWAGVRALVLIQEREVTSNDGRVANEKVVNSIQVK